MNQLGVSADLPVMGPPTAADSSCQQCNSHMQNSGFTGVSCAAGAGDRPWALGEDLGGASGSRQVPTRLQPGKQSTRSEIQEDHWGSVRRGG